MNKGAGNAFFQDFFKMNFWRNAYFRREKYFIGQQELPILLFRFPKAQIWLTVRY